MANFGLDRGVYIRMYACSAALLMYVYIFEHCDWTADGLAGMLVRYTARMHVHALQGLCVYDRRLGVTPTGKSFRFVRACARSGCQVEFELKSWAGLFPFPFILFSLHGERK